MSPRNWPSVNQVVELKEPMNGRHCWRIFREGLFSVRGERLLQRGGCFLRWLFRVTAAREEELQREYWRESYRRGELFLARLLVTGEEKLSSLLAHFSWRRAFQVRF